MVGSKSPTGTLTLPKMPVLALIVTGTVMFMHFLAVAKVTSCAKRAMEASLIENMAVEVLVRWQLNCWVRIVGMEVLDQGNGIYIQKLYDACDKGKE